MSRIFLVACGMLALTGPALARTDPFEMPARHAMAAPSQAAGMPAPDGMNAAASAKAAHKEG